MKISKSGLLNLSWLFTVLGLWLMVVSAADRQLYLDIDNASHYMEKVRLISSWSEYPTTLSQTWNGSVKIQTPNLILSKTWVDNGNTILTGLYSSILWWIKNRIEWELWDQITLANVIFGWSGNSISGYNHRYNVILWWESNKIKDWRNSIILWWENNEIKWDYNVILWSNNKIEDSTWSIVVWNNSSVKGNYSAALWSWTKIEANNSFLRNDGTNEETLTGDNLFSIMAKSGMVINTWRAHQYAKLTLWWPLIISSKDTDANIKCEGWKGGWILKMINTDDQVCLCGCDGWSRSSMLWKGNCTKACNPDITPVCGDTVTKQLSGSHYYFSGSCNSWKIVEWTWAYLVTKDNKVHWSCQTDDGQTIGCSGFTNDYKYQSCGWLPATGHGVILWNANYMSSSYEMNWDYTPSQNPWTCKWTCNDAKNFKVNASYNKCICKDGFQLSEDGQSCIEIPSVWCNPGDPADNTPATTTNDDCTIVNGIQDFTESKQRKFVDSFSTPSICERTCKPGCSREWNKCVPSFTTCKNDFPYECTTSSTISSNNNFDWTTYTRKCWDENCHACITGYVWSGSLEKCIYTNKTPQCGEQIETCSEWDVADYSPENRTRKCKIGSSYVTCGCEISNRACPYGYYYNTTTNKCMLYVKLCAMQETTTPSYITDYATNLGYSPSMSPIYIDWCFGDTSYKAWNNTMNHFNFTYTHFNFGNVLSSEGVWVWLNWLWTYITLKLKPFDIPEYFCEKWNNNARYYSYSSEFDELVKAFYLECFANNGSLNYEGESYWEADIGFSINSCGSSDIYKTTTGSCINPFAECGTVKQIY